MRVGERVRHINRPDFNAGTVIEVSPDGTLKVEFEKGTFSGVSPEIFYSVEAEFLQAKRDSLKSQVLEFLLAGDLEQADQIFKEDCASWWKLEEYNASKKAAREELAKRKVIEEANRLEQEREVIRCEIRKLLSVGKIEEADTLYQATCQTWWTQSDYERTKQHEAVVRQFNEIYHNGSLRNLDDFYLTNIGELDIPLEKFIDLKQPKLLDILPSIVQSLDEEQLAACARPERRLLVRARAGSGKTRTLSARAALAIKDENLDPNQVLILAFNTPAATEIKERVKKILDGAEYKNARTFHSLAYQLVNPKKKLLFDKGGNPSAQEQSLFVQRMMQSILNPAFKEEIVQFFRKELDQIEAIGRDLPPEDYCVFRRSLEHVTLGGQWLRESGEKVITNGERVKSKGEKFIADFFFEHDIKYRYESVWNWKADFLDGVPYKPDFSIMANGKDYILEHWALDPDDPGAKLPKHWSLTAEEYRKQIDWKRKLLQSNNTQLLETHTGMMAGGREAFEQRLKMILEGAGIRCQRLPANEIVKRVFQNDFVISRMAKLFLEFIQRAKKRGWSVDEIATKINTSPDNELRARLFHQLALRVYSEYEVMLAKEGDKGAMDYDDLLVQAAETVRKKGGAASIHLGEGRMMPIRNLRWILLDEYQDFSELYFRMLDAVFKANPDIRLVAVGDDWQAINAFAGAELRFIKKFADYFPGAQSVGVTTNYRSDRQVVAAGNQLMSGCGEPAKASGAANIGKVQVIQLREIWVLFVRSAGREDEWKADQVYLLPGTDGKVNLRQAQALKACVKELRPALENGAINETAQKSDMRPFAMLLSRTGYAYGLELAEFKRRLIDILEAVTKANPALLERLIDVRTAHVSKGKEAHTVIILDATDRQFPKIHPDNLLFQLFGVTPREVLDEERRLFYVAITRAEHRLIVLTDKGAESPYLKAMG